MQDKVVIQKLSKSYSPLQKGIVYYGIISAFNNLHLTRREIELLAYTNKRGTISSVTAKHEFCRIFNSTIATVNNMISHLSKKRLLVKTSGNRTRISVNPQLDLDLSGPVLLNLMLSNGLQPEKVNRQVHTTDSTSQLC